MIFYAHYKIIFIFAIGDLAFYILASIYEHFRYGVYVHDYELEPPI